MAARLETFVGELVLTRRYPDKISTAKIGDCIELRDGSRWLILPHRVMAAIGHRDGRFKLKPELRAVEEKRACKIYGDSGSVLAEIAAHENIRNSVGKPVIFVYDCGSHAAVHAVLDEGKEGKRSRVGFCGAEPANTSYCSTPQGGLCPTCREYVEESATGWVVRAKPKFQPYFHHELRSESSCYCYDDD